MPNEEKQNVWESIIIGVGASLMVPLFLNMISSNLLDVIRGTQTVPGDTSKLLVFFGFCLVAGISSRAFIRTISDRVLSEAKEAKQKARKADEKVNEIKAEIETTVSPALANLELFQEATSHVERGNFFADQNKYEIAREHFDKALSIYPDHKLALVNKAVCLKRMGDVEGALAIINDVLRRYPTFEKALYNRACYKALLGHSTEDVLADLRQAFTLFEVLRTLAAEDPDLERLRINPEFVRLTTPDSQV